MTAMETMGIIFSNIYDSFMGALTEKRTSASIPVGGRYRQIDFILSNMANSGVRHIGIITKYNYQSLMDHLGSCQEWDLQLNTSGVVFLPPYATGHTGIYRGKLEALQTALPVLSYGEQDYVILADSNVMCSLDFRKVVEDHVKSGCDVTVVAKAGLADGKTTQHFALRIDENNRAVSMGVEYAAPAGDLTGMGMFVMSRKLLLETIQETVPHGKYHLERDFIMESFNKGELSVNVYPFEGAALFNQSVVSYYQNNMALLDADIRRSLFKGDVPIYTKVRDEVPTLYGKNAEVANCIVADGCRLSGKVENSVIFREVKVEEGAEVADSIVMQGCTIEKGASIQYTILDKDVTVSAGTKLLGSPEHPLIIRKGVTV
ncbi:MAG: glucose-1-phosphate adenylyltransferase subunit GlgD [Oscillospiraceae bacterium]|nr:glucose-1-phosphate adenylyltransferase subunit GlgD [Oscillospiraceae bacterium]